MAVRASVSRFPSEAEVQEKGGLPWGISVTPFAAADETGTRPVYGTDGDLLPRCENCWAYFNALCEMEQWAWNCALCGTLNGLSAQMAARYSLPQSCPELSSSFVDLELQDDGSGNEEIRARPVYVAAVDLSASEEFLELVKSALLAALEALGPGSLFGLITFSHKIGLYDVQGPVPVVKHIFIPPDLDGRVPIELEDAMPLLSFLAPVENYKDCIAAALETLRPTTSWERTTAAGQGIDGVLLGGRGFGVAMDALISYLGSEYGNTFALARVFSFLSGPPDYGAGQLDTRRYGEQYASKGEDADRALLPEQTPFYKDLAAVAVQAGVCIDIFAVTNEYTDLASLKFLSIESGGSLFLYSSTDDSTLPQDLYRMLSRPYAFACVLRLRTSPEFRPGRSHGHFFPDPQYENVQHIICCDTYATYAYDFEFENNNGFSRKIMKISKDERANIRNMPVGMSKKVCKEMVKEMDIIGSHEEPSQQQRASEKRKENGTHLAHKTGQQGRKGLIYMFVLTYKEEPSEELIDIGLNMGCQYMLAYHKLIVEFMELEEEENNQHNEQNIPPNSLSHGSSLSSDSSSNEE